MQAFSLPVPPSNGPFQPKVKAEALRTDFKVPMIWPHSLCHLLFAQTLPHSLCSGYVGLPAAPGTVQAPAYSGPLPLLLPSLCPQDLCPPHPVPQFLTSPLSSDLVCKVTPLPTI